MRQVGAKVSWEPETCRWCQGQGFRDARRGGKQRGGRDGRLPGQEVGATRVLLLGAWSSPAAPAPVAQQPRVPSGGGTSEHFRRAGVTARLERRGTSGLWPRPPGPPGPALRRVRRRLAKVVGVAASAEALWGEAAVPVLTLRCALAGLVSAPFSQAHVLPLLRGPRVLLWWLSPRCFPGLPACGGLPALSACQRRAGASGPPSSSPCAGPGALPPRSLRARLPSPPSLPDAPRLEPQGTLARTERQGQRHRHVILGKEWALCGVFDFRP